MGVALLLRRVVLVLVVVWVGEESMDKREVGRLMVVWSKTCLVVCQIAIEQRNLSQQRVGCFLALGNGGWVPGCIPCSMFAFAFAKSRQWIALH